MAEHWIAVSDEEKELIRLLRQLPASELKERIRESKLHIRVLESGKCSWMSTQQPRADLKRLALLRNNGVNGGAYFPSTRAAAGKSATKNIMRGCWRESYSRNGPVGPSAEG